VFQLQANGLLHNVGPVGSTLINSLPESYMPQSPSQVILQLILVVVLAFTAAASEAV